MIALLVNQITISNLITRLVLIAAQHPTTPTVTAKNVSHVMKPVKFVLARQIIALLVIQGGICSLTLILVLQPATQATTVRLPATRVKHVIQLVPNVQVQD